ncbi:MAG: molybdopterin-dependent oxidoreductase [Thermoflexales bacterium]|nr:molybdopterin-dependent oxidoreductase [Thermoflexales bacterium]
MDYKNTLTTCIYCGCGCSMYIETIDGQITGVWPAKTNAVSQGRLCIKGWNVSGFVNDPGRLTTPLVRQGEQFVEVGWDEALALVAGKLAAIKQESGPDSIALLTSAKCTNEENYLMNKFARAVIGTNNIDHCARL